MDTISSEHPWYDDEEITPGDRVVLVHGHWKGEGATALCLDDEYGHWGVWTLLVDNGDRICINRYSFVKSCYQNEPLEEVPSCE